MAYYGYVGGGIKTVLKSWAEVEELRILHPYSSYRKFRFEHDAWNWVRYRRKIRETENVTRFGSTFSYQFVTMTYIIHESGVYYNFKYRGMGNAKICGLPDSMIVENRNNRSSVVVKNLKLGDTIYDHLSAIYTGLKIIGEFIDVEIVVPDHSIFYALSMYDGDERRINRVNEYIKGRLGNYSLTLKGFSTREGFMHE